MSADLAELPTTEPANLDAEQYVIGAALMSPTALDELIPVLPVEAFFDNHHRVLWERILALHADGLTVDPVSLQADLRRHDLTARAGAPVAINACIDCCVTPFNAADWHAPHVLDAWERRRVLEIGQQLQDLARTPGDLGAEELRGRARALLETGDGPRRMVRIGDRYSDFLERASMPDTTERPALPTGLVDLDSALGGGLLAKQLVIVGARPSVGKSLLLLDAGRHASFTLGKRVFFASLEMSEFELKARYLAGVCTVDLTRIITGDVEEDELARMMDVTDAVEKAPLIIDDAGTVTMSRMVARARQARAQLGGLDLICADYIQLFKPEKRARDENREQQVSAISRGLKLLAKELDVPVLVAAQLNRGAAIRPPTLADLRESGAIEQDADVVLLLHRDTDPTGLVSNELNIHVAKQRNGPTRHVTGYVQGRYARIRNASSLEAA